MEVGDSVRGKGSWLNFRFEGVPNNEETFARVRHALPLSLRPHEKDGERGTHQLGRIADIEPRSANFQREPVS
jgi:hypothetical protein